MDIKTVRLIVVVALIGITLGPWLIRQLKKLRSPINSRLIWGIVAGVVTALVLFFGIPDFFWSGWFWKIAVALLVGFLVYRGARTPQPAASSSTISTPWITWGEIVFGIILIVIGISVYHTWFSDQLIDQKEVAPGETWTTRYVDGSFYTQAERGREYEVKFAGCSSFIRFKTLENGATVKPPSCAKPGQFEIRLVPGDTLPLVLRIYKDRGFGR